MVAAEENRYDRMMLQTAGCNLQACILQYEVCNYEFSR